MQTHRAAAITAQARKQIATSPAVPVAGIRAGDKRYYNAAARLRVQGARGKGKIHEAGADGRPMCTMHQEGRLDGEYLGPGPVTCGKCAATRGR